MLTTRQRFNLVMHSHTLMQERQDLAPIRQAFTCQGGESIACQVQLVQLRAAGKCSSQLTQPILCHSQPLQTLRQDGAQAAQCISTQVQLPASFRAFVVGSLAVEDRKLVFPWKLQLATHGACCVPAVCDPCRAGLGAPVAVRGGFIAISRLRLSKPQHAWCNTA